MEPGLDIDFTPPPGASGQPAGEPAPAEHAEVGGIDIIVQMAHRGEIDPKNIDIIDLTDRFLKAIAAAPKENLRQSGKILFHASVLLRMKAEALLAIAVDDGDDFLDFDPEDGELIYDSRREPIARQITLRDLEKALVRRSHTRQVRQRKVTLEQLIDALREAERIDQQRASRRVSPKVVLDDYREVNGVEDILELAHEEDIESTVERIDQILADCLACGDLMSLVRVIELLGGKGDWVDAFLAVLFLSNAGKITLEQEQFYGPLYLSRSEYVPKTVAGEAKGS